MSNATSGAWVYQTETDLSTEKLNELGTAGWELVSVENRTFYLKRPALSFKDRVTRDQRRYYYQRLGNGASNTGNIS